MDAALLRLTDADFPLQLIEHVKTRPGALFDAHLHEHHLQIFYFKSGEAKIYINRTAYDLGPSDILLVNCNELHYGENRSGELRYFVFRIDLRLLSSYRILSCGEKYFEYLEKDLILLQNRMTDPHIAGKLEQIISECREKREGYELKLLGCVFDLLGELFRICKSRSYSQRSAEILMKKTKRFAVAFQYIEENYARAISLSEISEQAHMSEGYFCRMFKQSTGRTFVDYLNRLRVEKAVLLLNQGLCNVTEAAMSVGFDDINYFSRVFKKYMKQSPESYIKDDRRYFL